MQTFLPYPDFAESARVLDRQRLGKQRVEAYQLIKTLLDGPDSKLGWKRHPACRMWQGHGMALLAYTIVICDEWTSRGYKDTVREKSIAAVAEALGMDPQGVEANATTDVLTHMELGAQYGGMPEWLGRPDFHASHRSNLLRKAPEHYSQFGWTETPDLEYVWPVGPPDPPPKPQADPPADTPTPKEETHVSEDTTEDAPAESSNANLNREQVVEALRAAGWEGPVSYSKSRLVDMLDTLQSGGTIEVPRRGRKPKESDSVGEAEPAEAGE